MPERRPSADDVTLEKAVKHLFPTEAEDAVTLEPKQEPEPADAPERPVKAGPEQRDASAKDYALRRLRESPDDELALFADRLRRNALAVGATEQELRDAQSGHPGHG